MIELNRPGPIDTCASVGGPGKKTLVQEAIEQDVLGAESVDLGLIWGELIEGRNLVLASFFTESRCGLVLAPSKRPRLNERRRGILEAALSGCGQKRIAIELSLSPSTVAMNARVALESLGVLGWPSRTHPLLMLTATAAARGAGVAGSVSELRYGSVRLRVVSSKRPDLCLRHVLPNAEFAVMSMLLEGRSYREIARLRGTSLRTVANQTSAIFRRLRASGRAELVQRLFLASGLIPEPSSLACRGVTARGRAGDPRDSGARVVA